MRANLATDLADELRELIMAGTLPAGSRINEVDLARSLDVSRTPLREALSRLAAERFVENRPRRGFFVQDLGPAEVEQIYGVRSVLDPAALEVAGLPSAEQLDRLESLNVAIGRAGGIEKVIDLDDEWHVELLSHCPNRVLVDLIRRFMRRTRPLERAYLRSRPAVPTMIAEHARICALLREARLNEAVAALKQNMSSGIGPILEWLGRTPPTDEEMRR